VFFFKGVFSSACKGKLNRNYEASFKFILKGKKLSNISKAVFIIGSSTKTVRRVKGAFTVNNLKIIRRKVYCLACLTAF
jgi:hypothetical protein